MPPTEFTQSIQHPTASQTAALPRHFLEKYACLIDIQRFLHSPIAAKKSGHLEPTPPWHGSKRTVEMNKIFQSVYKSSAPERASTWPRAGSPALLPVESWRISHWPVVGVSPYGTSHDTSKSLGCHIRSVRQYTTRWATGSLATPTTSVHSPQTNTPDAVSAAVAAVAPVILRNVLRFISVFQLIIRRV